jgi:nitrogenase molybdenum-cofactor synthesis protein NifE
MSLYRYLPTPSDRMGLIWALLTAPGAIVLEYGPAGTTHYSVGSYGAMGLEPNQKIFTTHLGQEDVVMGDVSRLEEAIRELDQNYAPNVIFVVSSAVISVIGTDIAGVCSYMQQETKAKLIPVDTGGFKGDYTTGLRRGFGLVAETFCTQPAPEKKPCYNILGAAPNHYRVKSDLWEIKDLMQQAFGYQPHAVLGLSCEGEQLRTAGIASINLVMQAEALLAAQYLEKRYGTPYLYGAPYGYTGTMKWLEQIGKALSLPISPQLTAKLQKRRMQSAGYKMYAAMYAQKKNKPNAVLIGSYDQIVGFSAVMDEISLPVSLKICSHSLAEIRSSGLETDGILSPADEKEKIALLKGVKHSLVLGDDISLYLCADSCEKVTTAFPLVQHSQIAEHLPFMGIRGMDYLLESAERYYAARLS